MRSNSSILFSPSIHALDVMFWFAGIFVFRGSVSFVFESSARSGTMHLLGSPSFFSSSLFSGFSLFFGAGVVLLFFCLA